MAVMLVLLAVLGADPGPAVGQAPPKVPAHLVKKDEKVGDLLSDHKNAPGVVVLVRSEKFDRPLARTLRELDRESFRRNPDAKILMVFLATDKKAWRDRLVLVDKSLQLDNTTLAVTDEEKLMADWGASVDHAMTVVVLNGGKVVKAFGFSEGGDGRAAGILEALPKGR